MATFDWDDIEQSAGGGEYKDYAIPGVYAVAVESVDIHELDSGSVAEDFKFAETDVKYPKSTHWLSFKNDKWRMLHQRNLMMLFGATKEAAQKAVEICEGKGSKENIISAYQQTYDKLLKKLPKVEIEVWKEEGEKYSEAEFTHGSVRMKKPGDTKPAKNDGQLILDQAEPIEDDSIPF